MLKSLLNSILILILPLSFFYWLKQNDGLIFAAVWMVFYSGISFYIFHTDKINTGRRALFIATALLFLAGFKLTAVNTYFPGPGCPIAVSTILPAIFRNLFTVKGAALTMLPAIAWILLVLLVGRPWCSWVCWFGGIDEAASSFPKRKLIKLDKFRDMFNELPLAMLLFSTLGVIATSTAFFCIWSCPLKFSSSFLSPIENIRIFQTISFVLIGVSFLLIIPLFTKKRAFCRFICPLRGLLRATKSFHPIGIKINMRKCNKCMKCAEICPSLAISSELKIDAYCNFCMKCVNICKEKAISINTNRNIFVFFMLLLGGFVSILFIPDATRNFLERILK